MKKIYILALALGGLSLNAQFTDDFESYPEGPYFGGHWSNWSGSNIPNENIEVTSAQAASGSKSGLIGGNGIQDAILKLGNKFSGVWSLQQSFYIPSGSSGYFNFQEDETVTTGIWGIEFYYGYIAPDFPDNNSFLVATDEVTSEAVYLAGYDHPYDTWFTMTNVFDLDEGTVRVYFDGTEIYNGNAYLDSFQLGGVDYYSADPSNQLYIDDIVFVEGDIMMGVNDLTASTISVYPTVADQVINVSAKSNISEITVFNTTGQQVLKVAPQGNSAQVNVAALPAGVYVVKTIAGKEIKTTKVVVK